MAAILRFGAEDLFGQEDEAAGAAVVEEDLDAILARAEVSGGGGLRVPPPQLRPSPSCQARRQPGRRPRPPRTLRHLPPMPTPPPPAPT